MSTPETEYADGELRCVRSDLLVDQCAHCLDLATGVGEPT